jgi:hypothetical protein
MTTPITVELPLRLSVKDFAEKVYGNIGGVYAQIFNAEKTGFQRCIRRVGKKIFIDVQEYYRWQDDLNGISREIA